MLETVQKAQQGDAKALEAIVRSIQDQVHRLALRMMADVSLAEDATQDILLRIVTKLSTFNGESKFETWVYRVAMNHLLTAKKVRAADPGLNFSAFEEDLLSGLSDDTPDAVDAVALNELRVKCTMAMLLCLDANHRAAYVLGEILDMEHAPAAEVLEVTPETYRQRLSRARQKVHEFTARACGLASKTAKCHCARRVKAATTQGRIGHNEPTLALASSFSETEAMAAQTNAALISKKLQQATGPLHTGRDIASDVLRIVNPPGLTG